MKHLLTQLLYDNHPMDSVYIAIDTEFEGASIAAHNLLQICLVVFKLNTRTNLEKDNPELHNNTPDITIIDTKSFCFSPQTGKTSDPQCMAFWAQYPDIYKRIQSEMLPIETQFAAIQQWLNNIYSQYNVVSFVADIACADFPWLKSLYSQYCATDAATFTLPYSCISTNDIRDTLVDIGRLDRKKHKDMLAACPYPHTHYATEDALQTAYEFGALVQCKANITSKLERLNNLVLDVKECLAALKHSAAVEKGR